MGMNRDEDPQLWDLLGRSGGPTPSPFFARNVVRAVRAEIPERRGSIAGFNWRRLVPALSATAVVAITAFTFQVLQHRDRPSQSDFASAEVQDAEFVADLDVLVNDDDSDDTSQL